MQFDVQNLYSDAQAITASAASTNVIDHGDTGKPVINGEAAADLPRDLGKGAPIHLRVQVVEAFATLTSLKVSVQTADAENFSDVVTVLESPAVAVASLAAGYVFALDKLPRGMIGRYSRLNYTVAGSNATAGKVTAGIVTANQTNE